MASGNDKTCLICAVCASPMREIGGGYARCGVCRYMSLSAPPGAGAEVVSLEAVREKNFRFICGLIKKISPGAKRILDVGCSAGHFLRVASSEGLSATGLEPETRLADEARAQGHEVIDGFFPNTEGLAGKKYNVITFNDSLEHIPDLRQVLSGVKEHLNDHGLVVVSLPSSGGIIFKLSFLLYKLGVKAPFDRLWQRGFASPHLHCFNAKNLRRLFEDNGFALRHTAPLPFYTIKGLWKRISCKSPLAMSIFAWLAMVVLYPLFMLKSDSFMACFSVDFDF